MDDSCSAAEMNPPRHENEAAAKTPPDDGTTPYQLRVENPSRTDDNSVVALERTNEELKDYVDGGGPPSPILEQSSRDAHSNAAMLVYSLQESCLRRQQAEDRGAKRSTDELKDEDAGAKDPSLRPQAAAPRKRDEEAGALRKEAEQETEPIINLMERGDCCPSPSQDFSVLPPSNPAPPVSSSASDPGMQTEEQPHSSDAEVSPTSPPQSAVPSSAAAALQVEVPLAAEVSPRQHVSSPAADEQDDDMIEAAIAILQQSLSDAEVTLLQTSSHQTAITATPVTMQELEEEFRERLVASSYIVEAHNVVPLIEDGDGESGPTSSEINQRSQTSNGRIAPFWRGRVLLCVTILIAVGIVVFVAITLF